MPEQKRDHHLHSQVCRIMSAAGLLNMTPIGYTTRIGLQYLMIGQR